MNNPFGNNPSGNNPPDCRSESSAGIAVRLQNVRLRIEQACRRAGRKPEQVKLLAVSKTVPVDGLVAAIEAGQICFGENYVQEAVKKSEQLAAAGIKIPQRAVFHLIGTLQRNKVKQAVGVFELIHTVDRIEVAAEIEKIAAAKSLRQSILLQINISGEASKSGADPQNAADLALEIAKFKSIDLCGLMCIGSYFEASEPEELRRKELVALRQLRDSISSQTDLGLPELSMGMSHDFELAVEEGATIVRVGSAIFGARG